MFSPALFVLTLVFVIFAGGLYDRSRDYLKSDGGRMSIDSEIRLNCEIEAKKYRNFAHVCALAAFACFMVFVISFLHM